jgi:hypothetical protein
VAAAEERIGMRRSESSVSTTVSTNLRGDLVLNSWLTTCLWNFQASSRFGWLRGVKE